MILSPVVAAETSSAELVQDIPRDLSDNCRPDWIGEDVYNGYSRPQQHV